MERINWHEEPISEENTHSEGNTQQPLGRMLVPVGQPAEEPQPPKKKRRRQEGDKTRRRLIIHIVILVVLLTLIGLGIHDFLYEGPRQGVPRPNTPVQVHGDSLSGE